MTDAIDEAVGLSPGDDLHALRRRRPEFVDGAEACRASVMQPSGEHGLGRDLRAALACRMARLNRDEPLTRQYEALLGEVDSPAEIVAVAKGEAAAAEPLATIVRHVDLVTLNPLKAQAADIARLTAAGLTDPQIVALSELIAFVNFQTRVAAGLRLMGQS